MSALTLAATYEDLVNACKAPDRKERMKSLTKEMIADILINRTPDVTPEDDTKPQLMERTMTIEMRELRATNSRIVEALERMEKMEQEIVDLKEENANLRAEQKKQWEIIRQQQSFLKRLVIRPERKRDQPHHRRHRGRTRF